MEKSIGDLALEIMGGAEASPIQANEELRDISDEERNSLLESVTGVKVETSRTKIESGKDKTYTLTETQMKTIRKALSIVKEMTSVGMIGTSLAGAKSKEVKHGKPKTLKAKKKTTKTVKEWQENIGRFIN